MQEEDQENFTNSTEEKKPPYVVFYKKIKLPKKDLDAEKIKQNYLLEIQGEYIELEEGENIINSLLFFDLAHKYCPELVLKTKEKSKFLIFIHHNQPIIREDNVDFRLFFERWPKEDTESEEEKILDLNNKNINDTRNLIRKINKKIKKVVIKNGDALSSLAVFHSLYGFAQEIFYQDKNNQLTKIK